MGDNKGLSEYYVDQAIKEGNALARRVRDENGLTCSPKCADELCVVPVYEPLGDGVSATLLSLSEDNKCPIDLQMAKQPLEYVDAVYRKYDNKAKIYLSTHNYCWARFLACKELMHLYLEDVNNITAEQSDLGRLVMAQLMDEIDDNSQSIVDSAAYYAALEYLIPTDTVPLLMTIYERLLQDEASKDRPYYWVGMKVRAPEVLVEYRLQNETDVLFNNAFRRLEEDGRYTRPV